MDNGVVVAVNEAQLEERNGVEDESVESRTPETPLVIGDDDSKELDGDDDVFVEAITGDTPRSVPEERVVSSFGSAEKIEALNDGYEAEKFEEAFEGTGDEAQEVNGEEFCSAGQERSSSDQTVENKPDEDNGIVENDVNQMTDASGEAENLNGAVEISDVRQDPKKLENGIVEQITNNTVTDVVTAQLRDGGCEPLGSQNAKEAKGGNKDSNDCNGNDFQQDEVNETDGVIIDQHQDEKLKGLENASSSLNAEHMDSTGKGLEDFPTGSDVKQDSPSTAVQDVDHEKDNDAVQPNIASSTDDHGTISGHEINGPSPLVEKSEPAGGEKLLPLEDTIEKIDAGSSGLTADSSEGSEPPQGTSIHESIVVGKDMDHKDVADKVNLATPQDTVKLSTENCTNSKADLAGANAEVSESAVARELNGTSYRLYSEADEKDDQVPEVNQPCAANADQDVSTTDASSTFGILETPAHPAEIAHSKLGTREQGSAPSNLQEQVTPARNVSPSSNSPAVSSSVPTRPAGLGRVAPLLEPASRLAPQPRANGTVSAVQNQMVEDPTNGEAEETDETREKLQMIRVKFLRLAHRLGQTPHNVVVAQVLYRLGLAEQIRGRSGSRVAGFSFDRASSMAEQLEASGQEPLDFCCTIMVLGKTGVGKSATINSIFDEVKFGTDAFQSGTKKVQDVVGTVQGIKVRVIDTPGLLPSWSDQRKNEKILLSVRQYIKKTPPDIILYLDRLDMPSREFGDMPLLRTITEIFGPLIWFNAIVVLTHAASAPPEGPNGTTSYDMFVTQRSHVVQQAIRLAAGDMRLMNPVSLVENHSACRTNRAGQRVLPNGQVWKPHLLLLSFASKILAEANTLLKLQDSPPGKPFAPRSRAPSLPFLLSSLLQSRAPVKLPAEQYAGDDDALDDELDESSDSEDESEFDELPPFKRLTKAQVAKLPKDQRKAYNDELEYRERLFMKKQLKEEKKRRKMMKKMQSAANDLPSEYPQNVEEESSGAASVPVPMPDLALPASFDSDNPTHRYRCLDSSNQWLVRPVLDPNSWDHDVGYEGINVERLFTYKEKIPIAFSGQFSKDKKDTHLQMEMASTIKHGEGKATSLGFDMQSMGRDMAYTLRSETRFSNWRTHKALAGLSVTLLGDTMTGGVKIEDKLIFNKRGQLVVSAGAVVGHGDIAYGGSLEATLRDPDHPLGRFLATLGISVMDWHGDLAIGCNMQNQVPIGRTSNLIGRVSLNNRGSGQVSIRFNSSEHLQIILFGVVPLVRKLMSHFQPVELGG